MTAQSNPDYAAQTANASLSRERTAISKKLRFEVFKRDSFTCQYCGKRAPDVVLHCDHVKPLAEGGSTDILNLVTACIDCNLGKGPRELSDDAALTKQLNQLALLQERREQIEMVIAWQKELEQLDELPVEHLDQRWQELTGYHWTDFGKSKVRQLVKKYGLELVLQSLKTSTDQYLERDENGKLSQESVEKAFDYIGRIANVERREQKRPGTRKMLYIRGILRNRLSYCNEWKAMELMEQAVQCGVDLDDVEQVAKRASSWAQFRNTIEDWIIEPQQQADGQEGWRSDILERIKAACGPVPEDEAIALFSTAVTYKMPEDYLFQVAAGTKWISFKGYLEWQIGWRSRMYDRLAAALNGAMPDVKALDIIPLALDSGINEDSILTSAELFGTWRELNVWLENLVFPSETEIARSETVR